MSKSIKSYDDLLKRKQQLEILLEAQKELIKYDFQEVKYESRASLKSAGKVFTRDTSNMLLNTGASKLIDTLVKNVILSRAGWFMRLAVPFLLKNVSSHYIADHKNQWVRKLFSWIGNRNGKSSRAARYKDYGV